VLKPETKKWLEAIVDAGGTHPYDFVVIRVFWGVGGGGAVMGCVPVVCVVLRAWRW